MRPAFAVGLVFAGCCSNVIFLELLARWVTPVGRTKEAGGGEPPNAAARLPPAPSWCRSFLTPRRARAGMEPPPPGSALDYAPSALLPNSFSASLEGNPLGVCCRHPPVSYPGGLKPVEFPTPKVEGNSWQKPRFPPALLDPANASCMTWAKLGLKKQSDLVYTAKKVSVVLK